VEFPGCVPLMAKLLEKYPGRQDIVVRLGYALGNLLAYSDQSRLLVSIYRHASSIHLLDCTSCIYLQVVPECSQDLCSQMLESNSAMDSLLGVLALYLEKDLQQTDSQNPTNRNQGNLADQSIGSDGSIEDVIVKVRLQKENCWIGESNWETTYLFFISQIYCLMMQSYLIIDDSHNCQHVYECRGGVHAFVQQDC